MSERDRFGWTTAQGVFTKYIPVPPAGSLIGQLSDNENNRVFARKVLYLFKLESGEVRNEVRAIKKLCDGTHENLIHVFAIGELSESAHVFIDMELCAFNLKDYNKSNWMYDVAQGHSPDFIAERTWRIMRQIANGLVFIHSHGEVHRDIKPQNVLFSTMDRAWKLADFGLTCETTSKTFESTEFARGTPGYRAPELLKEGEYKYNAKADIWAMGCILFELVVGRKQFSTDLAVMEHYRSESDVDVDTSITFNEASMNQFSHILGDLLKLDPQTRPSAEKFLEFTSVLAVQANQLKAGTDGTRKPLSNSEEEFGRLKLFTPSPPLDPDLKSVGHQNWIVSFVAINQQNTRAVTLARDHLFTRLRVALWNTTTGALLWSAEEPINSRFLSNQHAVPTFTEGGEYLAVYVDQVVVVLDPESARILHRLEELPENILISAIALAPNGRTVALSFNADYTTPAATVETQLVSLSDKNEGKFRLHLVATSALSFVRMAYSLGGRRLHLNAAVFDRPVAPQHRTYGCSWESDTLVLIGESVDTYRRFCYVVSNHYSIIVKGNPYLAVQFWREGGTSIDLWPHSFVSQSTSCASLLEVYRGRLVVSIEDDRILILSTGTDFDLHDCTTGKWSSIRNNKRFSDIEGRKYKYLLKWEPFVKDPEVFARVEWGDLPPLHEIKAMAWKRSGFTLLLEDHRFVFFSEQGDSVYGEVKKEMKDLSLLPEGKDSDEI